MKQENHPENRTPRPALYSVPPERPRHARPADGRGDGPSGSERFFRIASLLLTVAVLFLTGLLIFRSCRAPASSAGGVPSSAASGDDTAPGENGGGKKDSEGKGPVICIDPGHGFTKSSGLLDVGCNTGAYTENTGKTEADFNLELALRLRDELRGRGYTVVMVREKNEEKQLEIPERPAYIDALSPDLCISLHGNSFDGSVTGTRVFVSESRPDCDAFATALVDSINRARAAYPTLTDPAASVKKDGTGIAVLRDVHCPVALVESCFLDAETDAVKAASPLWQDQMAKALADGIAAYLAK